MAKESKVLATLLKFNCIVEKHKEIRATLQFDMSKTSVTQLYGMRNFYVTMEEPDRGVKRPPLGEFSGKIVEIVVPKAPKKEGKIVMVFPDGDFVVQALRQIGACEPATVYLIQSELELEIEAPADDDGGQEQIPAA